MDAARTSLLQQHMDSASPARADDLPAAAAHSQAMARTLDQLATGERVNVTDLSPADAGRIAEFGRTVEAAAARVEVEAPATQVAALEPLPSSVRSLDQQAPAAINDVAPAARQASEVAGVQNAIRIESPELNARFQALEAQSPDLMVQLDGMDAPQPLREVIERVRREVMEDLAEGPLLQVAAECAIANG